MRLSWKLGRVAGIDLFLNPSVFILWFLAGSLTGLGLIGSAPLVLALYTSVALHEYGHALMARRYGIETRDITLYMIGGIARLDRLPRSAGPEILVALAGPAVNLVIAAGLVVGLGIFRVMGLDTNFIFTVLNLNLGLALFNLLPIFPMDGGRVFRALLSGWTGRVRATEIAAAIGQFLAIVGGLIGLASGRWDATVLAVFVYMAAATERFQVVAEARLRDQNHHGLTDPPAAPMGFQWTNRGDGVWHLVPSMGRPRTWGQS